MGVTQAPMALGEHPAPGDCVLVLSPSLASETEATCIDLLTPVDPDRVLALWVTLLDPTSERIAQWEAHCHETPMEAAVIDVGAGIDRIPGPTVPTLHDEPVSITEVTSPQNLTRLGVEIVDQLGRWRHYNDSQIVLCFHSLSTLLQYVGVQDTFKFLHALNAQLTRAGAIAHFHMDPSVHDSRTISTVLPLFRSVAEFDDGAWTFKSR